MKNIHKIRGKREFLFDDKELIVLSGGALVICILIFVLGFLIGKDLQEQSVASPIDTESYLSSEEFTSPETEVTDTLGAPPENLQETSQDPKKSKRSYYQVLPDSETIVEVEETPAIKAGSAEEPQPEKAEAEISKEEGQKEASDQPPATAPVSSSQNAEAGPPALPNVPRSPNDVIRVGRQTRPVGEETSFAGAVYSVQVASSTSIKESERLQQQYISLGYEAHIMTADLGEKGIWYRVRVGNLATRQEAQELKQEILNTAAHLANSPYVIKVTE